MEAVTTAGTGVNFIVCHKTTEPTSGDANLVEVFALAAHLTVGSQIVIYLPTGIPLLKMVRLYYDVVDTSESYEFSAYFTPVLAPV